MTPFLSPTPWDLSGGIFHFWISRLSKFNSTCTIFWSVNNLKHLHAKSDIFKPVNTDTHFLQKICYFLLYMFWYKFDINMSIPWTIRCDICSYLTITKPVRLAMWFSEFFPVSKITWLCLSIYGRLCLPFYDRAGINLGLCNLPLHAWLIELFFNILNYFPCHFCFICRISLFFVNMISHYFHFLNLITKRCTEIFFKLTI